MLYPYQEQGFCVYVEFTGMAGAYRTVRAVSYTHLTLPTIYSV